MNYLSCRHRPGLIFAVMLSVLHAGCTVSDSRPPSQQQIAAPKIEVEVSPGPNPWTYLKVNNDPDDFKFIIVTDLTGRLRPNVFPDAVRKINLLQPEFVMTIGDVIEGHTNDGAQLNREWDQLFKAVEPLEMPIFWVPGNHDYFYRSSQNAAGQLEVYDMATVYKQRVGRSYYHFIYKDVLFLILNNTMGDPAEKEAQDKYIAEILKQNADVRWTFTFFHYDHFPDRGLFSYVKPLLGDRPFTAFAGNSHSYLKYEDSRGREMIRLATTGGMSRMRGAEFGEVDHITLVSVTDKGPRIANLVLDGIYDSNLRTVKSAQLSSGLREGAIGNAGSSPFKSVPILVKDSMFETATASIEISNPADLPLDVEGAFEFSAQLKIQPAFVKTQIPRKSAKRFELKLTANKPIPVQELSTPVLNWKAHYVLPGTDPEVQVTGKHRIIVDTKGARPAADLPVIVEGFFEELDPAWVPLGPGGGFNDAGEFTLVDNPPDLPGERKDSGGRYTDGPLFETAVHTPVQSRVYRYTDGRGLYMMTPLFQLPVNGIYRDIPPDTFSARLSIANIQWKGDAPELHWEFWDSPDRVYMQGPSYLSGVIVLMSLESGQPVLSLRKFTKTGYSTTDKNYSWENLGNVTLETPPTSLSLRADWRESTRIWKFFYGVDGAKATKLFPGGEFVEDIKPSPDGKRNVIYLRQAKHDHRLVDPKGGFSLVLEEYRLLH